MSPSFEACRSCSPLRLELCAHEAKFIEAVDPESLLQVISPELILQAYVGSSTGRDGELVPPFNEARVEVRTRGEPEITSLQAKYPLGWLEVLDKSATVVVLARQSLVFTLASHLPLVPAGLVVFSITLPLLDAYPVGFYPILAYAYRAKAPSAGVIQEGRAK